MKREEEGEGRRREEEGEERRRREEDLRWKMFIFHCFLKVFGEKDNKNNGKRRTRSTSDAPNCSHRHF